jgi:type I restriction enzyme S subunit
MLNKTQKFKLDQLGFVGRGRSRHRPRNEPSLYEGKYPFFQTGDIKAANLYLKEYSQTYNEKGLSQSKLWEPGTLCITIAANIAETAILGIKGCFPDSVVGFIADNSKTDVRYVKYYIDIIKLSMQNVSKGTTQDNLSVDKLLQFDFDLPPLSVQQRIASILSAYDDLIENNARRIKILEEMAQRMYKQWFVDFKFPGHEKTKFIDSPLGKIPQGWEVKTFFDIAKIMGGGTPSTTKDEYWKDGHICLFAPKDCNDTFYVLNTEKKITETGLVNCNSKLYPKDTVFITARGSVGKIIMASRDIAINQSCYALVGHKNISQYYLFFALKDNVELFKKAASGATFDAIVTDNFKFVSLAVPETKLINDFTITVSPILKNILLLQKQNTNLRLTRDLLLPKLINGEIEIEGE